MAARSWALTKNLPACDRFYVVKHKATTTAPEMVTVLHDVPPGAEELASFEHPNPAIDFAEVTVRELRAESIEIDFVDPPNGLIGTG